MYGEGKFFFIRSEMHGQVLDIQDAIANPGQAVITWPYNGEDNQIWFEDRVSGVIRSKLDENLVLNIDGDTLTVAEFYPDEYYQQWMVAGNTIRHRQNPTWVLDIADCCDDEGARVCAWDYNGGDNQHWEINYLPPKRCFIVSQMNGRAWDVKRADPSPGIKVVMWDRNDDPSDNQLWWEDKYGIIRSCLNDMAPDSAGDVLRTNDFDPGQPTVQWAKVGDRIANVADPSLCVDIKEAKDKNGAKLIAYPYAGSDNQRFNFEYID